MWIRYFWQNPDLWNLLVEDRSDDQILDLAWHGRVRVGKTDENENVWECLRFIIIFDFPSTIQYYFESTLGILFVFRILDYKILSQN